jgi:hypothetical protein
VACASNPLLAEPLALEAFVGAGHVAVRIDGRNTYVENELGRLGLTRRVEVYAPSFIQAPWLLPGTRRIALMHERLACLMAPLLGLRMVAPPFELPLMREMAQFHATRRGDEGLSWLISRLRGQVALNWTGIIAAGEGLFLHRSARRPDRTVLVEPEIFGRDGAAARRSREVADREQGVVVEEVPLALNSMIPGWIVKLLRVSPVISPL